MSVLGFSFIISYNIYLCLYVFNKKSLDKIEYIFDVKIVRLDQNDILNLKLSVFVYILKIFKYKANIF